MRKLRIVLILLGLLLLAGVGAFLAYALPHHAVVHIDGHEVKRIDASGQAVDPGKRVVVTRDVFFIYAARLDQSDVQVFRNEDTRFGFPWYFKFDSSEVQGRAQLLARDNAQLALVTYYGWRIPMMGLFPNAVDVEAWGQPAAPFPVFNTVFFVVLTLLLLAIWWQLRKIRQRWAARK